MSESPDRQCSHPEFFTEAVINRLEDTGQFMADITIRCEVCGEKFRFPGLPVGLDINGASVSVDGCEARLAIAPVSETPLPLGDGQHSGFTIRRRK
jgi:hypothetical protein